MKRDAIERLAIDVAAGELNEDAEALFQTYLAENPQAKRWAEDVRQVYHETEAAITSKTTFTGAGTVTPKIGPALKVRWLPAARWAAAVVLGTVIGFSTGRLGGIDSAPKIVTQEPRLRPKSVETVTDLKEKYFGTFWGDKMLALLERKSDYPHKADLRDIRSWGTYRRFIKEKHNE